MDRSDKMARALSQQRFHSRNTDKTSMAHRGAGRNPHATACDRSRPLAGIGRRDCTANARLCGGRGGTCRRDSNRNLQSAPPAERSLAESAALPAVRAVVRDAKAYGLTAWRRTAWLAGFAGLAVAGTLWGSRQMLRALQRQAELSGQKSNFIASVSHELRTPLASLRVLSENLQAGRVSETEMRASYFPLMVDECRRLGALVENVLEFARAEDGRSEFHFAETDIAAMTEDTVQLVRAARAASGLQIETDASPLPEPGRGDAMSLHRALLNLLDNAIKFAPPADDHRHCSSRKSLDGGRSVCRTPARESRAKNTRAIFERFYRGGSELTRTVPDRRSAEHREAHRRRSRRTASVRVHPGQAAAFTLHLPYHPPQTRS